MELISLVHVWVHVKAGGRRATADWISSQGPHRGCVYVLQLCTCCWLFNGACDHAAGGGGDAFFL